MSIEAEANEAVPHFGKLMRRHRMRIGLTQRELADLSTISVRAIRDLEQGKARRPRTDTVRLIADGLRLGPRARADLEAAALQGRTGWALKAGYEADPPAPPVALHPVAVREPEAAAIVDELSSGAERLVNVVGLPRVGKTRLVLEVAARLHAREAAPVLWATLAAGPAEYRPAGTADDGLDRLVRSCAGELFGTDAQGAQGARDTWDTRERTGGPDRAGRAGGGDGAGGLAALAALVGQGPALLVVDGVPAGLAPRAELLARLLGDCPQLRLLATSEQPWDIPGERLFLLAPLEVPAPGAERDPEALAQVPAVRFFLDQARRMAPEQAAQAHGPVGAGLVAAICRSLDGLPFALRAAASWLVVCDLRTLRDCLADDPASLLDQLSPDAAGARFRDALRRRVGLLPAAEGALLRELCAQGGPSGPGAGPASGPEFGLEDVIALTGRSVPDCGRMVRGLLLHGLVRPSHEPDRSRFRVLGLVRAVCSCSRSAGETAAGIPEPAVG